MTRPWTGPEVKRLESLLADGLSYARAAKRLDRSRVAIAGAVRRHIHKVVDGRSPEERNQRRVRKGNGRKTDDQGLWSERALTETWAERKARQVQP